MAIFGRIMGKQVAVLGRKNMSSISFGKRQVEQITNWLPTVGVFGTTAFLTMCYFTEWRVTNEWIPFYNGKFK